MHFGATSAVRPITAVLLGAAVFAQPPAVPDPLVREGAAIKLGAHTYVIPDGNVPLVPNVGIVVGSKATLVIDPGLGERNGRTVVREVAKVSGAGELFVASTHFHAEHTTGYQAFPPAATYVNARVQEAEAEEGLAAQIRNFSKRSPLTAELLASASRREADVLFDREYRLDLGGVHVRFLTVGPTHTRGDTGFFVEEDGVLFSGDVVMNNSFLAATAATSVTAWLAAFDTFDRLRPKIVVPAHGATGDSSMIAVCRTIMQHVQSRARELKTEGRPADDVASMVQTELVAKHPQWPRANGLAAAARAAYAEAP
jgi:glyoxylase-like metal-dependent hydrolase (beta-lactamase superfamily II)